jgi:hypothetical protein
MARCKIDSSLDKCGSTISCGGCRLYEKDAPDIVEKTVTSYNTQRDAICPHVKSVCSHDGDDCTGIVGACEDWK